LTSGPTSDEFNLWLTSSAIPFWVGHHRFEKTLTGEIRVDNGLFMRKEALILFRMLRSRDPFTRLNGSFVIWERNKSLMILLLVVTLILLTLIIIRIEK